MALLNKTLTILLLGISLHSFGQVDRYMVFFTDKPSADNLITDPVQFLSQKSIDRRERQGLEIDNTDVPVEKDYIQEIRELGINTFHTTKWLNGVLVEMDSSGLESIKVLPFVSSITLVARGSRLSNSESIELQFDFDIEPSNVFESESQFESLNIRKMHRAGYDGDNITIAVLDAGFPGVNRSKAFQSMFEESRLIQVRDFVTNSGNPFQFNDHGTEVLSIMAGEFNEFIGSAPDANYLLYVTEDVQGENRIEEYNWLFAAETADSVGVDIIHSSLGYSDGFSIQDMDYNYEDLDGQSALISEVASMAISKGIFVVNSAGNEGNNAWGYITPPSDVVGVLSVGSVKSDREIASFSSTGPTADGRIKPDVVAPGVFVEMVNGQGEIVFGNGTSYSAPIVTGLVAGLWQQNRDWTNLELHEYILSISDRSNSPDTIFGYGIPGFDRESEKMILASDILENKITVYPNPFISNNLYIGAGELVGEEVTVVLYDIRGTEIEEFSGIWETETYTWNLPSLQNGIYILRLQTKNQKKEVKLIKQ